MLVLNLSFTRYLRNALVLLIAAGCAVGQPAGVADRIIISGASGQLGDLVVKELLARGVSARRLILVSRTPDRLEQYARLGASTRYGDFTRPETLSAAYAGGTRMLLISINSGGGQRPELHRNAIDAAVAAGVRHIAYTSFVNMDNNTSDLATDHRRTEEFLMQSGADWTMLRNSIYADGLVARARQMVAAGRVEIPPGDIRVGYVTRADCAAAAAAVLSTPGHENRAYDITGPELVGTREIAAAASRVTGKPVEIIAGDADSGAAFQRSWMGEYMSVTSTAVGDLTGRPATAIEQLFSAHSAELDSP